MLQISRNQTFAYKPKKYPNKSKKVCQSSNCSNPAANRSCENCGRELGTWCAAHNPELCTGLCRPIRKGRLPNLIFNLKNQI
jgi:hypothetical protein